LRAVLVIQTIAIIVEAKSVRGIVLFTIGVESICYIYAGLSIIRRIVTFQQRCGIAAVAACAYCDTLVSMVFPETYAFDTNCAPVIIAMASNTTKTRE
jgi:hypothetical protein